MMMADIQEIADRQAIRELIDRYTLEVTRRNWDGVAACFHEDARWVSSVGHDFQGQRAIKAGISEVVESYELLVQMNHGVTIDDHTATRATARSVLNEFGRAPAAASGVFVLGVYTDDITKVGGRWGFAKRFFQVHYIDVAAPGGRVMVDYKDRAMFP
jgi:uncharacterized protein (TIGR02246 family)